MPQQRNGKFCVVDRKLEALPTSFPFFVLFSSFHSLPHSLPPEVFPLIPNSPWLISQLISHFILLDSLVIVDSLISLIVNLSTWAFVYSFTFLLSPIHIITLSFTQSHSFLSLIPSLSQLISHFILQDSLTVVVNLIPYYIPLLPRYLFTPSRPHTLFFSPTGIWLVPPAIQTRWR